MAVKGLFILFCIVFTTSLAFPTQDSKLVTESKPGQEYVFVQSSGSGARPISRKDKNNEKETPFETAHKLPPSLTFTLNDDEEVIEEKVAKPTKNGGKKVHKRAAPAPPGAIKLNVAKLLEKYKEVMKTSTTEAPSSTTSAPTKASRRRGSNKRTKKEIKSEDSGHLVTSPRPVLTTSKISPKSIDVDDIPLVAAGSEKQRSRIQIKKGPNGQEYEYEYVYYYYDDDEDPKDKKSTNAHDGPAKNSISSRSDKREKPTPEANEVLPSRGKTRGRQLGEEEPVSEERLPANTRSRNLNTTPIPEEEPKASPTRSRGRGRPSTEATSVTEDDNVSDETQGSRGRTRPNIRRPSLVDSETFNTHSGASPAAQSPAFPPELPAGPEGPTKNQVREPAPVSDPNIEDGESTTQSTGMDKVALDLYAISQGTQKLFGEEGAEVSTEEGKGSDEIDATTAESSSTEFSEVESTTPTTTTTTTTTTTPAPTTTTKTTTTTTTTEAPTKASRFGGRRGGLNGRKTTTTSTEAPANESKPKKFGRPSFGGRARTKTTAAPAVEEEANKEESKPASQSKPSLSRSRFGAARPRGRTTAAPAAAPEENKEDSSTSAPVANQNKPSLPRSRPSFNNLRTRGRTTTAAPSTEEGSSNSESAASSEPASTTTARPRRVSAGSNVKSLRPGPRINLAGRRGAQTTTTTEAAPEEDHVTGDEEETHAEAASEKEEAPAAAPVDNSPLGRLRNRNRINVQARPKAAAAASASAPVQVRRVNPLLARRRPGQTTEAPSSEPSVEAVSSTEAAEEPAETEAASSSTSTTEEPRGLNKLLAGRRRLGARTPGTLNHSTK